MRAAHPAMSLDAAACRNLRPRQQARLILKVWSYRPNKKGRSTRPLKFTLTRRPAFGLLARERLGPGDHDFPLLYAVAELVSLISEINPRRESAAESRFQLVSSTEGINIRSAASFIRRRGSILAKVVGEIDSRFGDFQQRLGQNAFGVNHVVAFELYVEVLEFIVFALLVADDGRPVD